ncbi:MAG: hypothetical protein ACREBR_01780 [bacterium]
MQILTRGKHYRLPRGQNMFTYLKNNEISIRLPKTEDDNNHSAKMKFCPFCGFPLLHEGASFCCECGKGLKPSGTKLHDAPIVASPERKARVKRTKFTGAARRVQSATAEEEVSGMASTGSLIKDMTQLSPFSVDGKFDSSSTLVQNCPIEITCGDDDEACFAQTSKTGKKESMDHNGLICHLQILLSRTWRNYLHFLWMENLIRPPH